MRLDRARVVVRERTSSEITDLAYRFVVGLGGGAFLRLGFVVLLPVWAFGVGLWLLGWHWAWIWLVAVSLATPLQGVFTVAAGSLMFESDVRLRDVRQKYLSRVPAYLWALILSRLLLTVSLIIPVLYPLAWARVALVHEAVLLEGATGRAALGRAARLARTGSGAVALMLLGQAGLTAATIVIAEILGQSLVDDILQLGRPLGELFEDGGSVFALFGYFLSVPLAATARFLTYIDHRTRRDAWDVQVRFMAIAAEAARRAA